MTQTRKHLLDAVRKMMRPLVHILLRNGVSYGELAEMAKWVYVDIARREFTIPGRKQTAARISVITGLTRKEVARLSRIAGPADPTPSHQYNRAARVIAGWRRDPRFTDAAGEPLALPFESDAGPEFSELVRQFSGDMPARAVLDELIRVNAVARLDDDRLQLVAGAYVPEGDEAQKLLIMGTDSALLLETLDHNLHPDGRPLRFQRKVAYDNLPGDILPALRALSAERAQALLAELDRQFAALDRDENPEIEGTGRFEAGIGIYYFEKEYAEDDT